jgi:hypothetical protein
MLTTATGAGAPSLAFVCPQYAMTYLEGCHVTIGEGAKEGTRWSGTPVSVAHCSKNERLSNRETKMTHDVNIRSSIRNRQVLSVVRETQCIDAVPVTRIDHFVSTINNKDSLANGDRPRTNPVIQVEHIHNRISSTRSQVSPSRIKRYRYASSNMGCWRLSNV